MVVKAEELQEKCTCITYLARTLVEWQMTLPDTKFAGVLKKGWMMSSCFLLFLVIVTMSVNKLPVLNLFFSWHPHLMTNMPTPKNS